MAHIPTLEEALVSAYKHLGLKEEMLSDKQIERFKNFENISQDTFIENQKLLTTAIFNALEIDCNSQDVAQRNLVEWAQFNKALEINLWTGEASQQQVTWYLMAYVHVPHLARRVAFWQLANNEYGLPAIDAGMPGGEFWYLPKLNNPQDKLIMPLNTVIDWLLDLLSLNSIYALEGEVQEGKRKVEKESAIKTLNNWRKAEHLPKNAEKIDHYFPDGLVLDFNGAISLDEALSRDKKYELTLAFLTKKNLDTPEKIHDQIPMNKIRILAVLNKSASSEEKDIFINQIQVRYAIPTMKLIRQRLKVARMCQSAYEDLLKLLCPETDKYCADSKQNKLLQLIALFQTIYNSTIESWSKADSVTAQDRYFESKIEPWDKYDLLISVIPSIPAEARSSLLAQRLTRIFFSKDTNSPLENLVPYGKEINDEVCETIKNRVLLLKEHDQEDERLNHLKERILVSSPWRALQNEHSYWVVGQLAGIDALSAKLRNLVTSRMRELAKTEGLKLSANLIEIDFLLNEPPKSRPTNAIELVENLLSESERSSGYNQWKAPLLNVRAKHCLFRNDIKSAIEYFKEALDACKDANFGQLRGLIARDLLGLLVFSNKLNRKNDKKYYLELIYYSEISTFISFDESLKECGLYFENTLYKPYL